MDKRIITLDRTGHDHKIEKVDRYPETQPDNQIFCYDFEVGFYIGNLEFAAHRSIEIKYAELRKQAEGL
jgi:hypothetical protein